MKHPEFIQEIDWKLLREQKQYLLDVIAEEEQSSHEDELCEGLIGLIDALQDYAVDEMGLSDKEVFNLEEDEKS